MWPICNLGQTGHKTDLFFLSRRMASSGAICSCGEKMKKTESLKKNRQFQEVYKTGACRANKYLVMYVSENDQNKNLLGISVSKKVGNSVVRHRVKRLVKESYRLHEDMFNSGLNIVITARAAAASISYSKMESAVLHLGKLHRILCEKPSETEEARQSNMEKSENEI